MYAFSAKWSSVFVMELLLFVTTLPKVCLLVSCFILVLGLTSMEFDPCLDWKTYYGLPNKYCNWTYCFLCVSWQKTLHFGNKADLKWGLNNFDYNSICIPPAHVDDVLLFYTNLRHSLWFSSCHHQTVYLQVAPKLIRSMLCSVICNYVIGLPKLHNLFQFFFVHSHW